jgi:hypothetical protein
LLERDAMPTDVVTLEIDGGSTSSVPWSKNMNVQGLLEDVFDQIGPKSGFTYALQYYGEALGYLVVMINETYDSFISSSEPFFYWEFLLNGKASDKGIDNVLVSPGDHVTFTFQRYDPTHHKGSTLEKKFEFQSRAKP